MDKENNLISRFKVRDKEEETFLEPLNKREGGLTKPPC